MMLLILGAVLVAPLLIAGLLVVLVEHLVPTCSFYARPEPEPVTDEADVVVCESCQVRPADKQVRLGGGLFAVCSSCAPARKAAAS